MPDQVQCPNCGGYKVEKELTFIDQKTGKQDTGAGFCAMLLLGMLGIAGVGVLAVIFQNTSLSTPIQIVLLAAILIFLWLTTRGTNREASMDKVYKYECRICGYHWQGQHQSKGVTVRPELIEKGEQLLEKQRRKE